MNTLEAHAVKLIVQLHPPSFRARFGQEMLLDYQADHARGQRVNILADAVASLATQWLDVCRDLVLPPRTHNASPRFLTNQCALGFQAPLTPYELTRGLCFSILLFSAFWYGEDPMRGKLLQAVSQSLPVWPAYAAEVAQPEAASRIVIEDVTIVDLKTGKLLPHRTVVIEDGTIMAVAAANAHDRFPGADHVDGRGRYLMPGMWDMHSHIIHPDVDLPLYVANGVLGIRGMGGVQDEVFAWDKRLKDGSLLGPRALVSGPIVDGPTGPVHPASYGVRVANAEQAHAEVDDLKRRGADFVKVYDGLSRESYFAIADQTSKDGLTFAGHVPDDITILEAVHAGQRSIEHGIEHRGESTSEDALIEYRKTHDFMAEAMKTQNFSLIPAGIAEEGRIWKEGFSQTRADALYRAMASGGTYLCPTLVTEKWGAYGDEMAAAPPDPRQKYIDPGILVYWQPSMNMLTKYRTPAYIAWFKTKYTMLLQQIPRQQALGVQLLAGTDLSIPFTYPGSSVHDEIRLFAAAGLTPLQALQTATTHPIEFFGLTQSLGEVSAGKQAELVLLNGDPLRDLNNLDHIEAVVTHKKVLRRAELDQMMAHAAALVQTYK